MHLEQQGTHDARCGGGADEADGRTEFREPQAFSDDETAHVRCRRTEGDTPLPLNLYAILLLRRVAARAHALPQEGAPPA